MITSTQPRVVGPFIGNGTIVSLPFSFKIFDKTEVSIAKIDALGNQTVLVLDSDYSVSLNSDQTGSPGGVATLSLALMTGETAFVVSNINYDQQADIINAGGFYPEVIENSLDRIVSQVQQLKSATDRALTGSLDDTSNLQLPNKTSRSSKALGFDANGNPIPIAQNLTTYQVSSTVLSGVALPAGSVVNLPFTYVLGVNALRVYKNGSKLVKGIGFTETSATSITLTGSVVLTDVVEIEAGQASLFGSVAGTAQLTDQSVTTQKLADGSVTTVKIGSQAVTNAKLAPGSVTSDKFDSAATAPVATLANTIADGAVSTSNKIAANVVTTTKLARQGSTGQVLLSKGSTADPAYGDVPGRVKASAFPKRCRTDIVYPAMMVLDSNGFPIVWGRTFTFGWLGVNETSDTVVLSKRPILNVLLPAGVTITKSVMTNNAAYLLASNGWVYSAGQNTAGQLGHGDTTNRWVFTRIEYFVTNNITVTDVFAGGSRGAANNGVAFFLNAAGQVYATGFNLYGQLGVGTTTNLTTPQLINGTISGVVDVLCDQDSNTVFLRTSAGQVYSAGFNATGQLGVGNTTNQTAFQLNTLSNVIALDISAGSNTAYQCHVIALTAAGQVYTTGSNLYGQLGLGDTTNRSSFTLVPGLSGITGIGAGGGSYGFSWAYKSTNFYTTGYNGQGALGIQSTANSSSFVSVNGYIPTSTGTLVAAALPFLNKIVKVLPHNNGANAGYNSLFVLDTDGNVWLSGYDYGFFTGSVQQSRTSFTQLYVPADLYDITETFTDIFVHSYDTNHRLFALTSVGNVYGIGFNDSGITSGGINNGTPAQQRSWNKIYLG